MNTKSFTLIEILVALVILGILSTFIIVSLNNVVDSANDAKRKKDLDSISKMLMTYKVLNGSYPSGSCYIGAEGCLEELSDYTTSFPKDPSGSSYHYSYNEEESTYTITAVLSNGEELTYNPEFGFVQGGGGGSGPWYDNSWLYRKEITINSNASLTDYQVKIDITYVSGKMNADLSDLRFTLSDSITELKYWIESTDTGTVWVKIPSLSIGDNTIYMYYGNNDPLLVSTSDGDETFLFFDDFENGNVNDWILSYGNVNSASLTADNIIKKQGAYSLRVYGLRPPDYNWVTGWAQASKNIILPSGTKIITLWHRSDVCGDYPEYNTIYVDGSEVLGPICPGTTFTLANTSTFTNSGSVIIALRTHRYAISFEFGGNFDPVFIRKYTTTEPSISSWGEEESI